MPVTIVFLELKWLFSEAQVWCLQLHTGGSYACL